MYFLDPDRTALVTSASDLTLASDCEFAFLRVLDVRLGRASKDDIPEDDATLQRVARLGDRHELRLLERYRAEHGDGLVEFDRPEQDAASLRDAAARTHDALRAGAPVVYQGVLFDETNARLPFVGYVDFFVRQPDGRYRIVDTKLARRVKVTALLQLAAYHEQLERLGVPVDDEIELILGDDRSETANIDDVRPVFRRRRARMHAMIAEHRAGDGPVAWGDPRWRVDGRCKYCGGPAAEADDLITVAGMRLTHRERLRAVGITTATALAATPGLPDGSAISSTAFERLRLQAQLQGSARVAAPGTTPPYVLLDPRPILGLPPPSPGDLFFDFEGDPMHAEVQPDGSQRWGLDYLFGWVDAEGRFDARWAHTQAEEARALTEFLDMVHARLAEHPDLHIYHYAAYEKTHLLSIAARHGVGEHAVDDLLRRGILVDLYPVVTAALRIGVPSYSIKQLEPLYMGDDLRTGLTGGMDAADVYLDFQAARDAGRDAEAQAHLDRIADYNEYDCRSTLRLRDWLRGLPELAAAPPPAEPADLAVDGPAFEPSEYDQRLQALAADAAERGDDEDAAAYRLAAAAIDFHRREAKSFWWEHYARLEQPPGLWEDTRGVFVVDDAELLRDWHIEGGQRVPRRHLRLRGRWAPGSGSPSPGAEPFLLYADPPPFHVERHRPGLRAARQVKLLPGQDDDGLSVDVAEMALAGETWAAMPTHLTPAPPPRADSIVAAIEEWGARVIDTAPAWPADAMTQLLRREPGGDGRPLEPMAGPDDAVRAVTASLLAMPRGYLAVQGPPGTGKTYLAAHVIRTLVAEHGWRVGVTAQSHKVIENVLDGVVLDGGLDPDRVAKKPDRDGSSGNYALIRPEDYADFAARHADAGYVLGGTAWDMTNRKRVEVEQFDLLVIDEAGQFSLANTIGTATSARRLLLLGDPQQLPQVSQGVHPAPVDGSALGHVIGDAAVLPAAYGYFLPESRRMDAAVTRPVSRLAYEGRLRSHPTTRGRRLDGVAPGLHPVAVEHTGHATASPEEAAVVVGLVRDHLGLSWTPDADEAAVSLGQRDLIVVTPYNAQVELLRAALDAAGFDDVAVGTVDRFQGREAVIAIVSLAASDATEVPRGFDFLIDRNRMNVSISRAKWAAYLVHSPALLDHLPGTPDGVATLSRFIQLIDGD